MVNAHGMNQIYNVENKYVLILYYKVMKNVQKY